MSDLISRQAAIDALNDEYHGMISDESMKIYQIVEWLNTLPSAQPDMSEYSDKLWRNAYERGKKDAQRTGRWIIKEIPGIEWYRVTCSACGEDVSSVIPTIGFFPNVKALWDFCPECGARMEVEDND